MVGFIIKTRAEIIHFTVLLAILEIAGLSDTRLIRTEVLEMADLLEVCIGTQVTTAQVVVLTQTTSMA
jgi:hypothetical protein